MTRPEPNVALREARTRLGMSRETLAAQLGISSYTLGRWERGEAEPGPELLPKLFAIFNMTATGLGFSTPEHLDSIHTQPLYDPAIPPLPVTSLVGREDELFYLRQQLTSDQHVSLHTINGLPGIGKTTLAIALTHDPAMRQHFHNGILWAGLGPDPNISAHLGRWGQLLGIGEHQAARLNNPEAWALALRGAIGERSMLLVIDDAWSVEAALALKVGGPNCVHLVTTRAPAITARISVDQTLLLHELDDRHSIQLLRDLAPQVVEQEEEKTHRLVQAIGGLPLALTLVGNYLRKQGYSGLNRRIQSALARLNDARQRLTISEPQAPAVNHPSLAAGTALSLQSIIAVTDQQLDEAMRQALYTLSILPPKPASFSEAAALAVAQCSPDTLDALVDTGLLESSGAERYTLHQTIADYARLLLTGEQATRARQRLAVFMLAYVETHAQEYERLDQESSTLIAALEAAYTLQQPDLFLRLVLACMPFMQLRSWYTLAKLYLQRANEMVRTQKDISGTIDTLRYLGEIAHTQGEFTRSSTYFQEGLTLTRQLDDKKRISTLLADLGRVTWKQGDYVQAEIFLQEGLTIAHQNEDTARIIDVLRALGALYNSIGDYVQAEKYLSEGLNPARPLNNREQILTLLINLGVAVGEQGNYKQAEKYFQEGLSIARQIGHLEAICALLGNLGETASDQGKEKEAEAYIQEGLLLTRQIGHREWTGSLLINLGAILRKNGNFKQAETYLCEGLALARQIARPEMIATALYECGQLYLAQHQYQEAKMRFSEMLHTTPEKANELVALAQYGLARIAAYENNSSEARLAGENSLRILQKTRHRKTNEVREWLNTLDN